MSVVDVAARVAQLQLLAHQALRPTTPPADPFAAKLASAVHDGAYRFAGLEAVSAPPEAPEAVDGQLPGLRALSVAQGEVGQAEQPPGSNESPRIAEYRSAVAGAYAGAPWCAYFVSWAAAQAGTPIGDGGSGYGAVTQIADWASRTGKLLPPGAQPQPGDLILYGDRHVGIVERVEPDGSLTTVEGNSSDAVSRVRRSRADATGFVRL